MTTNNKPTGINYYTETNEIEIFKDENYVAYFENLREFADLIKTYPRLTRDLMELLEAI